MKKIIKMLPCVFSVAIVNFPSAAFALVESYYVRNYTSGDIVIDSAADGMQFSTIVANAGYARQIRLCSNSSANYTLRRVDYVPVARYLGETYTPPGDGTAYLFDVGTPGFALIPLYNGIGFNGGNNIITGDNRMHYAPVARTTVWIGNYTNGTRIASGVLSNYSAYVWKGADRPNNGYTQLPAQEMYRYECYDGNNTLQEINHVGIGAMNIRASTRTCRPEISTASVNMGAVPMSSILNANSTQLINTQQITLSLLCDPSIVLYYSVSDLNNTANRTSITTLTNDSTAKGIGFTLTNPSGTRLIFGPDGSAAGIPEQTKYYIGSTGGVVGVDRNIPMAIALGFSYIRDTTTELKSGIAKSLIGITYSYQ